MLTCTRIKREGRLTSLATRKKRGVRTGYELVISYDGKLPIAVWR
jgi:hypothetical protein